MGSLCCGRPRSRPGVRPGIRVELERREEDPERVLPGEALVRSATGREAPLWAVAATDPEPREDGRGTQHDDGQGEDQRAALHRVAVTPSLSRAVARVIV